MTHQRETTDSDDKQRGLNRDGNARELMGGEHLEQDALDREQGKKNENASSCQRREIGHYTDEQIRVLMLAQISDDGEKNRRHRGHRADEYQEDDQHRAEFRK